MLLKNKQVVVTGSNRGIGKKIVEIFSQNGANIVACSRKLNDDFVNFCSNLSNKYNNKIYPIELDLSQEEKVKLGSKEIINLKIPIDILINNSGIIHTSTFQMTTSQKLKEIFEVNFFSHSLLTQYMIKIMSKQKNGSIIYISSSSGIDADFGRSAYSASKAAIINQAKTLSRELGTYNIRVNSISPGLTETDMMLNNTKEAAKNEVIKGLSIKRLGQTEDIANMALFLSSDLSKYVTGQNFRVDGGM